MKTSPKDHKDPQLAEMLQSAPLSKAPEGLADKLMLSVEAVGLSQKKVRKNLNLAMAGVFSTLGLMLTWLVGGSDWVANMTPQSYVEQTQLSSALMLSITALGMIALFIEIELVVRYWWQWRRLQLKS